MSMKSIFSERLKALRKEIGISQEAFADALGVTRPTLSYYEKGDRLPDVYFLDQVCKNTECSLEYLMGYSENMKSDYGTLGADTKLSDKAIDALVSLPYKDIMNFFIEHPEFEEFIRTVKIISLHVYGKIPGMIDESYREFKMYQADGIIRRIIQDACDSQYLEKSPLMYDATYVGKQPDPIFAIDRYGIEGEIQRIEGFDKSMEMDFRISQEQANSRDCEKKSSQIAMRKGDKADAKERERTNRELLLKFRERMTGTPDDYNTTKG